MRIPKRNPLLLRLQHLLALIASIMLVIAEGPAAAVSAGCDSSPPDYEMMLQDAAATGASADSHPA